MSALALVRRQAGIVSALLMLAPSGTAHDLMLDPGGQSSGSAGAGKRAALANQVVEIRSYNLKPGTRERFHQLFLREALPMLQRWKIDVVAYGPSLHDADLMRAYDSVEGRSQSEDAFYGSEEWRKGPREAILADIDSYTTVVIRVDGATLEGLRRTVLSRDR